MPDMLCSLVHLPMLGESLAELKANGISIRRADPWDKPALDKFIIEHFTPGWAAETAIAFTHQPVTCFVAFKDKAIVGFADYECTRRNFFGPTGVDPAYRGLGIGKVLFIAALRGLREIGYTYCIIGAAGPVGFYEKCVGAIPIAINDGKGIYGRETEPGLEE